MLCKDSTHDDRGYLYIERGGLSLLITDQLPVNLTADLALRATRDYIGAGEQTTLRFSLIDLDGNELGDFSIVADPVNPNIHAAMAGQNYEMPMAFGISLERFSVKKPGQYRIDAYANDALLGTAQFRVNYLPKPPTQLASDPAFRLPVELPVWL